MAINQESFNTDLYRLLRTRGYKPVPKDAKNQRTQPEDAEVFNFTFIKDGKDYGDAWVTIDDASNVVLYYSNEQEESPSGKSPNLDYDDSWSGLKRHLKQWSMNKQLTFELRNKDELGDDMAQRDYVKKKEKMNEGEVIPFKRPMSKTTTEKDAGLIKMAYADGDMMGFSLSNHVTAERAMKINHWDKIYSSDFIKGFIHGRQKKANLDNKQYNMNMQVTDDGSIINLTEGYHSMGKKASYNDNIPAVKIILQHNRQIEEGEQRYRNIAKIFLENQDGERFLAPTTRPGIAQVYARHIAEGGVPNDERWNHIKAICEDYSKMAGFVRATKNKQFNESAQSLVNEGINHYQSLRETLGKLRGHRGYNQYFESWTPALMEDDTDGTQINELFVQETVDPRIESVMPILSRLHKKIGETQVKEVSELAEWADSIVEGETLTELGDSDEDKLSPSERKEREQRDKKEYEKNLKDTPDAIKKKLNLPPTLEEDSDSSPVESAIIRRIINVRTELLGKHGPEKVLDAVKEVASYVGDVDEIGSSDVSGWIRQVERILSSQDEDDFDADFVYGKSEPVDNVDGNDFGDFGDDPRDEDDSKFSNESLDKNQKKAGQLGPTEKVGKAGAVGKLVGANESIDPLDEIKRLIK